jgi:hypothetical protein
MYRYVLHPLRAHRHGAYVVSDHRHPWVAMGGVLAFLTLSDASNFGRSCPCQIGPTGLGGGIASALCRFDSRWLSRTSSAVTATKIAVVRAKKLYRLFICEALSIPVLDAVSRDRNGGQVPPPNRRAARDVPRCTPGPSKPGAEKVRPTVCLLGGSSKPWASTRYIAARTAPVTKPQRDHRHTAKASRARESWTDPPSRPSFTRYPNKSPERGLAGSAQSNTKLQRSTMSRQSRRPVLFRSVS